MRTLLQVLPEQWLVKYMLHSESQTAETLVPAQGYTLL
jgi:hypothetical protein